jgi:signal peptidase II
MSSVPGESATRIPVGTTLRSRRAWTVLLVTVLLGLVTDLWSKSIAFAAIAPTPVVVEREDVLRVNDLSVLIPPHDPVLVVPNLLEFTLVLNPGAVFGIGAGRRVFFIGFTLVAIAVSLVLFARWTRPRDWAAHLGFGLIISGGLGNLYDRIRFACVRDFIHPLPGVELPFGLRWPGGGSTEVWPYVSNVADLYLLIGIGILLVYTWRQPPAPAVTEAEPVDIEPA